MSQLGFVVIRKFEAIGLVEVLMVKNHFLNRSDMSFRVLISWLEVIIMTGVMTGISVQFVFGSLLVGSVIDVDAISFFLVRGHLALGMFFHVNTVIFG